MIIEAQKTLRKRLNHLLRKFRLHQKKLQVKDLRMHSKKENRLQHLNHWSKK